MTASNSPLRCDKCQSELEEDFEFCPDCGESVSVTQCSQCQKQIKTGSKFCPYCRAETDKPPTTSDKPVDREPVPTTSSNEPNSFDENPKQYIPPAVGCAMPSDNFESEINTRQQRLKALPDEEVMRLHLEELRIDLEDKQDKYNLEALYKEARRREVAAGWIWKRFFNPAAYEKWVRHSKLTEIEASRMAIKILSKTSRG